MTLLAFLLVNTLFLGFLLVILLVAIAFSSPKKNKTRRSAHEDLQLIKKQIEAPQDN